MKKINGIAGLLLAALLLCLAGCGESKPDKRSNPDPTGPSGPVVPLTGPQQFQLTGVDGALQIKFTKIADAQNIQAKYDLRYGTSSNFSGAARLGTNVLQVGGLLVAGEITGLTNGTTYYVWINAVFDTLGESAYHMEEGIPVPTPDVPKNVVAKAWEKMIELTWDESDYAFNYEVAIHTGTNPNGGQVVKRTTTEPRYMITAGNLDGDPLTNGTTYNIWVNASNTNGTSGYSAAVTAAPVAAAAAPVAPGVLTVDPGKKRLKVTWDSVPWAVSYDLYYNTSNDTASAVISNQIAPASGTVSATIAGLTNGTPYYVWVKAKNSRGGSGFSPAGNGTPQDISAPINFSNYGFQLGEATAEFIFAEHMPLSGFSSSGQMWDRLTRAKETHLGNLFTDGVMWYLRDRYPDENVDFVFLNGGYIDNVIKKGPISLGTIAGVVDSRSRDQVITLLSMKGSDIKALFDDAAKIVHTGRGGPSGTGAWAIVSKEVNYAIAYPFMDPTIEPRSITGNDSIEPWSLGGEIKPGTLKFNGADFEDGKTYRIATTDDLADGNSYLRLLQAGSARKDLIVPYWHALAEYIYDAGSITPGIDGRIRIEGGVPGGPLGVAEGYNKYCPAGFTYDPIVSCVF